MKNYFNTIDLVITAALAIALTGFLATDKMYRQELIHRDTINQLNDEWRESNRRHLQSQWNYADSLCSEAVEEARQEQNRIHSDIEEDQCDEGRIFHIVPSPYGMDCLE